MSKIQWTEQTWNPIVGCSIISPGCTNCYAMRWAGKALDGPRDRETGQPRYPHYAGTTKRVNGNIVWTGKIALAPEHIVLAPLKRKRPTTYFVNSMSDLFHEGVPEEWLAIVFDVMAQTPQHTYQVLTKRSARMRQIMAGPKRHDLWHPKLWHRSVLPNVWLGVSAEDQTRADERVPDLRMTPAAVRFVSAEPLLGPINFLDMPLPSPPEDAGRRGTALDGQEIAGLVGNCIAWIPPLDWVIVGGESGPGARRFNVDWADDIILQCRRAGIACFVKQVGSNPVNGLLERIPLKDRKGGDPAEWPESRRVRQMPEASA